VDFSRVSLGEMIAGVGGLGLFVFLFLPWYGVKLELPSGHVALSPSDDLDAWSAFSYIDVLLLFAAAIAMATLLARALGVSPRDLSVPPGLIVAIAGAVAVILIAYRLIDAPGADMSGGGVSVEVTRKLGIFLSLIAAAGITFGGYRAMLESEAAAGR
jgi:hypothetical protein